jgi:multidrug efflux system membrane fusion protein
MTNESSQNPYHPDRHRKLRLAALVVSLATLTYFTAPSAGLGRKDQPARRPGGSAIPVGTAAALRGDIPVYLDGLGTVTPLQSVTVRSRVDGELVAVHFSEGQPVKKGELLAEIDPRPFQAQLAQAEGQLARDQALLENSRADLQRYQTLLQQDSIASQQVTGQAALVRQHQAAVAVDQGQIAAIKLQLSYCRITAPVSGRAGLRLVDPGNIVRANDASGLVVISQVQPIAALFSLPEDKLPAVMTQLRANPAVTTDAYDRSGSNRLAAGKLLAVDNQIDPATGTVKLKAVFPNDDGALFANQFVNVRMNLEPLRGTTIIPTGAVQRGSPGDFAYVVDAEGKVRLQTLKLGPRDGERVAVLEGLAAGEQVVVEGTDRLRDGATVQVIAADGKKEEPLVAAEPAAEDSSKPRRRRP